MKRRRRIPAREATLLRLALPLLALCFECSPRAIASPKREEIQAALVYKFAQFVEWRAAADPSGDSLTVGVLGSEAMVPALEAALRGRTLQGHPVTVRSFARPEEVRDCRILFVDVLESRQPLVLGAISRRDVLTIGPGHEFVHAGGVIGILVQDGQVKFEINLQAADEASITIHAALLGLASEAGRW